MFRLLRLLFLLLVPLAILGAALSEVDEEWENFKTVYDKQYGLDEADRRSIWEENVRFIENHNREADAGLHTYRLGMNKYGDMTSSEFSRVMNGLRQNLTSDICHRVLEPVLDVTELPSEVDWVKQGYVTEIKDQGQCGSCWAFSATGALEGQHYKKTKQLVSLSEKNLMDCSQKYGNEGCDGGLPVQAFSYVIENGGIDTEASYPYEPKDGNCKFNKANIGATEKECYKVGLPIIHLEGLLQRAVADVGPISVGIDASQTTFQLYKSGVYSSDACSSTSLDHGVLAVGYGTDTDSGMEYWLVKNSWGKTWGMEGYIKMRRNYHNMCGIATAASYPTV